MSTFWTADLHLGHTNIIKYCDRPYKHADEMNEALIANWNDRVTEDDEVWVLGDVALGHGESTLSMLAALKGHKYLLVGNHDRIFPENKDAYKDKWRPWYKAVFEEIYIWQAKTTLGGLDLKMCHFPYEPDERHEKTGRFTEYYPKRGKEDWLIHGHVHTSWKTRPKTREINVGVDVWDYSPVSEQQLLEEMGKR